jgi:hypothetical protein
LFFSIFICNVLESDFENFDWVVEFLLSAISFALVEVVFLSRLSIIWVLQALLKLFNFKLELLLAIFTLRFE